ncbi:Ribosomal L11 methyltransferase [Candidatus Magnetoovum chiemensis]|nr:Ribosomal L11 methyltransferase [Candidatus Magnetoovum chiemensis]
MLTSYEEILNHYKYSSNPYEYLWIYYLKGTLKLKETLKNSFIGNWEEDGFSFLFFSEPSDQIVERIIAEDRDLELIDKYEMTGEAWHGEPIESYRSGIFCISPPWKIPYINEPNLKHILLDPCVVFGTGRHPTTEDCLKYIEYLCSNEQIETVIDIGTGTGLLAIAAAMAGCKKILAIDFNLLAVKTAQNNIKLNSLEDKILAVQARGEDFILIPSDLLIANIHYDVMRHLLENPHFLDHKWFILSGLLKSEVNKVIDKLNQKNIRIVEISSKEGVWNTILAEYSTYRI